ncbi:MAG: hypothetical protein HRU70_07535 [Phycisphaeraceae bacterium]|nr:MAG: hypothetical protein HRU70_07535 [Phycisphaeraceae bacterium]
MPGSGPIQFEASASQVLGGLRRAVSAVLSGLDGVSRAVDVADRLGIDRSLAWKVWRVSAGEGGLPSPAHIPGRAGFERFLKAARNAGVGLGPVTEAREAYAAFGQLAGAHGGDRATADIMLGALTQEGKKRQEWSLRRDAFHANSHFLGVRCDTLYQADALLPPPPGYMPEVARLSVLSGFRRMRADVPWIISRSALATRDGLRPSPRREPLEGGSESTGLVERFCSLPTPGVIRRRPDASTVEDEIQPGPVGEPVTVVLGERVSMMPFEPVPSDAVTMAVFTPAERLCYDVLIPEGMIEGTPELKVHSTVHGDTPHVRGREYDRIPVFEGFVDLGPARDIPAVASIPGHGALLGWFLERLGAPADRLRGFRAMLRYPPIPCRISGQYTFSASFPGGAA